MISYLLITIVLFGLISVYFTIADKFNIIDKPNERSSHSKVTIRGGGIVFSFGALLYFGFFGFDFPFFILGLVAIALISFLDDILTLPNKIRLSVHLIAVLLLLLQWNLFALNWYWLLLAVVFVIATINAYNFMDGTNGITAAYSLITLLTLYFLNQKYAFTANSFIIIITLSVLIFGFFNFRKKAKCFAGDVGSVSIAFILIFMIGQLILKTEQLAYILLMLLYGMDTVTTIIFRVLRKENIFEAHRSHFYQYLANENKWPHIWVAILYFVTQLLINCIFILALQAGLYSSIGFALITTILFVTLRFLIEGKYRLLKLQR